MSRSAPSSRKGVQSVIELDGPDGTTTYAARLVIDTMGSVSPIAMGLNDGLPFDGVCPTAGTILEGLEGDKEAGDVLVSVASMQDEAQLIWEGFPGRAGETTVYLFYYDRTGVKQAQKQSLLALFEQYFTLLPTYRPLQPGMRHLKPVFGYIPARHGRTGRTRPRAACICLGNSAAGQSPLTFCGFGSFVRHIGRVSHLLSYALNHDLLDEKHLRTISPHQANLRVAWVFSRFMQPQLGDPSSVNRLMNVFSRALDEIGPDTNHALPAGSLYFQRIHADHADHRTSPSRRSVVYSPCAGRPVLMAWAGDIAYFAGDSALRSILQALGPRRWRRLERAARRVSPALALRLISLRTAWQALN